MQCSNRTVLYQIHIQNIIKGHQKVIDNKDMIDIKRKEYAAYKQPLPLPEMKGKGRGNNIVS